MMMKLIFAALLLAACGPRAVSTTTPKQPPPVVTDDDAKPQEVIVNLEPIHVEVVTDEHGQQTTAVTDARTLFEDGNDALMQGQLDEAIAAYERIITEFPDSQLMVAVLYNDGIAHEKKGEIDAAIAKYQAAIVKDAGGVDSLDAQFRLGEIFGDQKRYADAETAYLAILDREQLGAPDRIEALARLGWVRLEAKDYPGAEETLRSALLYAEQIQAAEQLPTNYYVVMAQYYLAVIPERQFEVVPLRYPEEQMTRDVEHKSELFLLAQDRFFKTVSYGNLYWTTASQYQIGAMYKKFWDDLLLVPMPKSLDGDAAAQKEYVLGVNDKTGEIEKLIKNALVWHEKNIVIGQKVADPPHWVRESAAAAADIRDLLARQDKGELFPPGAVPVPTHHDLLPDGPSEYIPFRPDL